MGYKTELDDFEQSTNKKTYENPDIRHATNILKQAEKLAMENNHTDANRMFEQAINMLKTVSITATSQNDRDYAMELLLLVFSRIGKKDYAEQCLESLIHRADKTKNGRMDWFLQFYSLILLHQPIFPSEDGNRTNEIYYLENMQMYIRIDESYHLLAVHKYMLLGILGGMKTFFGEINDFRKITYLILHDLFKVMQDENHSDNKTDSKKNGDEPANLETIEIKGLPN